MEIEFKLSCTPAAATRLSRQLGQLTGRKPQRLQLQNAYYDTPQQALRAQGIALRIRRQGKRLLQTVKCAGEVSGGLSRRPEWESAYRGAFDFSGIDNATVRERLETLAQQPGYRPILDTDFERCIWHWRPASDTCVEIALDRGTIRAGGKEEAICELELELVEGTPERLFDLVAQLGNLVPLFPAPLSKATRGSLLLTGAQADSALAPPTPADASAAAAFTALAQDCLDHISLHLPANRPDFDDENLHQVRVGLRRLRALLELFEPMLRKGWCREEVVAGARAHMRALAPARMAHVLMQELAPPQARTQARRDAGAWRTLRTALAAQQQAALAAARAYLLSAPFAYWLLHSSLALHARPLRRNAGSRLWSARSARLLRQRLRRFGKRLDVLNADVAANIDADAHALHALRKRGKHLRYQLQAGAAAGKHGSAALKTLEQLQDALGGLNDIHAADSMLPHLPAPCAAAVSTLKTRLAARRRTLLQELPPLRRKLRHRLDALARDCTKVGA